MRVSWENYLQYASEEGKRTYITLYSARTTNVLVLPNINISNIVINSFIIDLNQTQINLILNYNFKSDKLINKIKKIIFKTE